MLGALVCEHVMTSWAIASKSQTKKGGNEPALNSFFIGLLVRGLKLPWSTS